MVSFLPQWRLKFIGTRFKIHLLLLMLTIIGFSNYQQDLMEKPIGSIKEASVDELLQEELDVSKL